MKNNNKRPNANLVRQLVNNSWDKPAVTIAQAEAIIAKLENDAAIITKLENDAATKGK